MATRHSIYTARYVRALILCMMCIQALTAVSQAEITTIGNDFWFGFMDNNDSDVELSVFISSETTSNGIIEMPNVGWSETFTTIPGQVTTIEIPISAMSVSSGLVGNNGVHIESDNPISVYCINYKVYTADGTRIFPKQFLDIEYVVASYSGLGGNYPSELLIVATEDGTEIEINPSVDMIGGYPANVPFTVQLNQGETYLLQSDDAAADVSGTAVTGTEVSGECRPFAVFGGSQCANIPVGCSWCDHVFDQTIPKSVWGNQYFTVPIAGSSGYTYRILAGQDNTSINIDGIPTYTLDNNEFIEVNHESEALYISANAPILVIQYMQGRECSVAGDPAMFALNSTNQTMSQVTFATVVTNIITNHNLNIIIPSSAVNDVYLDGIGIDPNLFEPFPGNPTTSYAQLNITEGSHNIQCDQRFTAYAYGTGQDESYAYSVGASTIDPIEPIVNITCSNGLIALQSDEEYLNPWWSTADAPEDTLHIGQPFVIEPPIENETYILHGTDYLSGCETQELFSTESPTPLIVDIEETSIDLCLYQEYMFTASVSPAGSDYQYDWTSASAFSINDVPNAIISPSESGYYYLNVETFSGCATGKDSVYVNVIGDDVTYFDALSSEIAICAGDTILLNAVTGVNQGTDLFNNGLSPTLWNDVEGSSIDTVCGSISGSALYFRSAGNRFAETENLNLSEGGS